MSPIKTSIIVLFLLAITTGCSTLSKQDNPDNQVFSDPFENFNRKVHNFNQTADKYVLKPVTRGYDTITPKPVKTGVSHFFSNLNEPVDFINNLLQGKFERSLQSAYRFIVNSTLGIGGLFDVAKNMGVQEADEDLGQTLAAWGVKPGPYIVLPFLGPSNLRDAPATLVERIAYRPIDELTDSNTTQNALLALSVINTRYQLFGADKLLASQLDTYSFLKSAYQQRRIKVLYDGDPPQQESEDFNDF